MSGNRETSLQLLEIYYAAFNRGDSDAMIACLSEDFAHDVNQGTRRMGKDQFREFNAHMTRCYQENLTDLVLMANEDGTRASAEFIVNGIYKQADADLPPATGQTYRLPAGTFFDIKEGKITRVTTYYNLEDWIAQVNS